jgi:hypothetical protein
VEEGEVMKLSELKKFVDSALQTHGDMVVALATDVLAWDPVSRSFKRDFYIELALDWENYWEYLL